MSELSGQVFGFSIELAPPEDAAEDPGSLKGTTVFRANLPATADQQARAYQRADAGLRARQTRLAELAAASQFSTGGDLFAGAAPASHPTGQPAPPPPPEDLFASTQARFQAQTNPYTDMLDRLQRLIGQTAWVETRVDGRLVARTVIAWSGEMDTTWLGQPPPALTRQHLRSVRLFLTQQRSHFMLWVSLARVTLQSSLLVSQSDSPFAAAALFQFYQKALAELGEV